MANFQDHRFRPGEGGRKTGARNKLSHAFLTDLLDEWSQHGPEVLRICRIEDPISFAKLIAGILPREFEISTETSLAQLTDEDLDRFIEFARRRIAESARDVTSGETKALDCREPSL